MTVRQIQLLLLYLGYDCGDADGISGPKTENAVKQFRQDAGLDQKGDLESALKRAVAEDFPSPIPGFWKDIRYFTREEFRCQCGGKSCNGFPAEPEETLLRAADKLRAHFGRAVLVSSGLRCSAHNRNTGGVANSRHLSGKAMDFTVGRPSSEVLAYIESLPEIRYAYAIDGSFVHMDIE